MKYQENESKVIVRIGKFRIPIVQLIKNSIKKFYKRKFRNKNMIVKFMVIVKRLMIIEANNK